MFNALLIRFGIAVQRVSDDRGTLAVEHCLIVGLIAVVIIGAAGSLGSTLFEWLSSTADRPFVP